MYNNFLFYFQITDTHGDVNLLHIFFSSIDLLLNRSRIRITSILKVSYRHSNNQWSSRVEGMYICCRPRRGWNNGIDIGCINWRCKSTSDNFVSSKWVWWLLLLMAMAFCKNSSNSRPSRGVNCVECLFSPTSFAYHQ